MQTPASGANLLPDQLFLLAQQANTPNAVPLGNNFLPNNTNVAPAGDQAVISEQARIYDSLKGFLDNLDNAGSVEEFRLAVQELYEYLENNDLTGSIYTRLRDAVDFVSDTLAEGLEHNGINRFSFDINFLNSSVSGNNYASNSTSLEINFSLETDDAVVSYNTSVSREVISGQTDEGYFRQLTTNDYQRVNIITTTSALAEGEDNTAVRAFQDIASKLLGFVPKSFSDLLLELGESTTSFTISTIQQTQNTAIGYLNPIAISVSPLLAELVDILDSAAVKPREA